ncbi:MAG TPA: 2-phosphosulfolactate phosphatase [Candidatus Acidoferrales bacterium]|nr:2-phosphosulfolactate phosphatase [Candidatus Acidoferrales bacterium]
MEIRIEHLIEGSKKAKGVVVIIDVFRAFSTAAYIMHNGAEKIIPVGSVEEARQLKRENLDYILIGERNGIKIEGFDYGNSPAEVEHVDFSNKTVIQTTSAGTQGVVNATGADEIILGSFVCLQAIVNHIKKKNPPVVTLVAMGDNGLEKTDEDEMCAQAIKDLLLGNKIDFAKVISHLRSYSHGLKFFDTLQPEFREDDFHLALEYSKFDFVLTVYKANNILFVTKEV